MTATKPRLLVLGWYKPGTGFTRVIEALCREWRTHHDIIWLGVGYRGGTLVRDGVRIEPTDRNGGDWLGAYEAVARWPELAPDAVFVLNDLWLVAQYARVLGAIRGRVPLVAYLPLDGRIVDAARCAGLGGCSALVTYTEVARRDLEAGVAAAGGRVPVRCAGHGVDLAAFAPEADVVAAQHDVRARMQLAQRYFALAEPSYVVLNASRPDPRKRVDLTLAAFARFVANKPANVYLCLHQALRRDEDERALAADIERLGLRGRVLLSPATPGPVDEAALARLYAACAVGVTTTLGEGFGLVAFEHAATGAPQVMPRHAALAELWEDDAVWVEPARRYVPTHSPLEMGEVDVDEFAAAMQALYDDPARHRALAVAGLARVHREAWRWAHVAKRFEPWFARAASSGATQG